MYKKYLTGLLTAVLLLTATIGGVLAVREKVLNNAQAASLMSLSIASTPTAKPGDIFYVNIYADTKGYKLSAADITVQFDPNFFDITGVSPGNFLPVVFKAASHTTNTASVVVASQPGNPVSGTGILFTITLKAKATYGSTDITLAPSTVAAVKGQPGNVAGDFKAFKITILPAPNPTPIQLRCNSVCNQEDASMKCGQGLSCLNTSSNPNTLILKCRNPQCSSQVNCICSTATPTPTPVVCNQPCNGTVNPPISCQQDLVCYTKSLLKGASGLCRKPNCLDKTDCLCGTSTPTPTSVDIFTKQKI